MPTDLERDLCGGESACCLLPAACCLQVGLSELKHIEAFCSFDPVLWQTVHGAPCTVVCKGTGARHGATGGRWYMCTGARDIERM